MLSKCEYSSPSDDISSSLYSDDIQDDCYKTTTGKNKKELKINQKLFIDNIIKKSVTEKFVNKILICGHEPLLVYRRKFHETEYCNYQRID